LQEYHMQTATKELRKIVFGKLFQKVLNDTKATVNTALDCKIHMYSGHDCNLAHILIFFQLMYHHLPNYGSCVIIEVHKIGAEYGIKAKNPGTFKNCSLPVDYDYSKSAWMTESIFKNWFHNSQIMLHHIPK
ncbi:hypothetical protein Trydic_g1572, partial [Trypoxylus dichotomus]